MADRDDRMDGIDLYADVDDFGPDLDQNDSDLYDDVVIAGTKSRNDTPTTGSAARTSQSGSVTTPNTKRYALLISNLTWWTTDQDITNAVANLGVSDLHEIKFHENRVNGQSKGFANIILDSERSSRILVEKLPRKELHGQLPVVQFFNKNTLKYLESQTRKDAPSPPPPQQQQQQQPPQQYQQPLQQQHQSNGNDQRLRLQAPPPRSATGPPSMPPPHQAGQAPPQFPPMGVGMPPRVQMQRIPIGAPPPMNPPPSMSGPPPPRGVMQLPPGMPPPGMALPPMVAGAPRPFPGQGPPPQNSVQMGLPPPSIGQLPPGMTLGPPPRVQLPPGMPPGTTLVLRGPPPIDPRAPPPRMEWSQRPPGIDAFHPPPSSMAFTINRPPPGTITVQQNMPAGMPGGPMSVPPPHMINIQPQQQQQQQQQPQLQQHLQPQPQQHQPQQQQQQPPPQQQQQQQPQQHLIPQQAVAAPVAPAGYTHVNPAFILPNVSAALPQPGATPVLQSVQQQPQQLQTDAYGRPVAAFQQAPATVDIYGQVVRTGVAPPTAVERPVAASYAQVTPERYAPVAQRAASPVRERSSSSMYQSDQYRRASSPRSDRYSPRHESSLLSDVEFDEILQRNKTVSSSAISRAVQDASAGEFVSAIETLVTAIALIKQSKISSDDRCKILISSLQDTLHGIESKSYGSKISSSSRDRRSRSRERDRERVSEKQSAMTSSSRHRSRSRERDREYRERSRGEKEVVGGGSSRHFESERSGGGSSGGRVTESSRDKLERISDRDDRSRSDRGGGDRDRGDRDRDYRSSRH